MMTSVKREDLAVTAAALRAVVETMCLGPIQIRMAGYVMSLNAVLDHADRVLAAPLSDEELAIFFNQSTSLLAALPDVDRSRIARETSTSFRNIEAELVNLGDEIDGE